MADHLSRITNGEAPTEVDEDLPDTSLFMIETIPEWSEKIVNFLVNGFPPKELHKDVARRLIKECELYSLIAGTLYKLGKDDILKRCAREDEYLYILQSTLWVLLEDIFQVNWLLERCYNQAIGGPHCLRMHLFLQKGCDEYQRYKTTQRKDRMLLHPIKVTQPFQNWGLDFVGPINPAARNSQSRYIIVAIDYVTKWAKAKASRKADAITTAKFLFENIIAQFGCPFEIVSDNGTHFINEIIKGLTSNFMISHHKSTPYYPQANGQPESTNKILISVLTKTVEAHRTDWDLKLTSTL
ncbi:hypothetical protein L7F22_007993 [Adiantum nelumboides]|nr:hypothetical protein [Adiantum nelumboides]